MREILFRGKRCDNGEWGEGSLVIANDRINKGKYYILATASDFSCGDGGSRIRIGCFVEVDPATVGQYTGLTDKNGKKIFEGDIFDWGYAGARDLQYVVVYDAQLASFVGGRVFGFVSLNGVDIEIIGNIHDNPELLNGERKEGAE